MPRHGVFPGSFDPFTVAHLAIADAARQQCRLDRLDLVISEVPLAKEQHRQAPVDDRLRAIEERTPDRPWLRARATGLQLVSEIAVGYDVLVLGADKWHQLHDRRFYADADAMHRALDGLPTVALAPRHGFSLPEGDDVVVLALPEHLHHVSSTAVRQGRHDWRA